MSRATKFKVYFFHIQWLLSCFNIPRNSRISASFDSSPVGVSGKPYSSVYLAPAPGANISSGSTSIGSSGAGWYIEVKGAMCNEGLVGLSSTIT